MRTYFDTDKENYLKKQKTPSAAYRLHYQLVFSTKYRKKLLNDRVAEDLIRIILDLAGEERYHIFGIQILGEHVHIVISLRPEHSVAGVMKMIKGRTSKVLRDRYDELRRLSNLWTSGYSADSLGDKNIAQIIAYLQEQQRRHRAE